MPSPITDMVSSPRDAGRPRGILTKRDRKYLMGESDVAPNSQRERNIRHDIRDRLANAVMDFELIADHLSERDYEEALKEISPISGLHGMMSFLYRAADQREEYGGQKTEDALASWLERGVYRAQTTSPPRVSSNIEIRPVEVDLHIDDLEELDVQAVERTVKEKGVEALSENELLFLLWLARREKVADRQFIPGTNRETVIAELADRIGDGWGLRGHVILDHAAYHDDEERAEREERRERFQSESSEDLMESRDGIDEDPEEL